MNRFSERLSRRGSALLIVLGFLSFMMVSAVSFAIYMRIERQASSNYRHTITARHMLNAALYRAIDEIDSELRIERVNTEADVRPRKYPDWPGHAKPSAVPNGLDNAQESRVLSMEALSFLPGVFVNDVRRYAVTNKHDSVSGVSLNNDKYSYLGTKWRALSMPVASLGPSRSDSTVANAYEEAIVGRYAYLCVNVSDMLDVNVCKASARDAFTNRVSIGHLFGSNSDAARQAFDNYVKNTGRRFETMQDFYACMYANRGSSFYAALFSPFHEYMKAGNATDADAGFDEAGRHILITDTLAKAQPAKATACNILLQPPFASSVLTTPQSASVALQNTALQGRLGFRDSLVNLFAGRIPANADVVNVFAHQLADYIDEDSIPKALNVPSVELVPMVSQILIPPLFKPRLMERPDPASGPPPAPQRKIFFLNAQPLTGPASMQVQVEVVWPYKHLRNRTMPASSSYDVEVLAYLKLHTTPKLSNGFNLQPSLANGYIKLAGTQRAPDFSSKDDENPAECYRRVDVTLSAAGGGTTLDFANSNGALPAPLPDYVAGQNIMVSLVVFARVKRGNTYVDSAPQVLPFPRAGGVSDDNEFMVTVNKLYFQTASVAFDPTAAAAGFPGNGAELTYDYNSLEVPDPRFNYKAANWVKNTADGMAIPQNGINPSTTALLGREGRDGDIFMSVSDAGKLHSPGELGFLLRPFKYDLATGAGVDFRNRVAVDPNVDDSDAYFRTVRLYDHTNTGNPASDLVKLAKDRVYEYFTAQNSDGSVPGARINPLSDFPLAFASAVELTPTDYWFASRDSNNSSERTIMLDNTFNKYLSVSDWNKFTNGWSQCFVNLRTTNQGKQMRTTWRYGLPDYYGDHDKFGWYVENDPRTIFSPRGFTTTGVPASLTKPLHEIDRKMLYSFSLDAFSDRQQLFLYFLRAEVTVPSFGSSQESGTKSLAGGRAVALVWRDPYPERYDKDTDSWLNKGAAHWYSTNRRISPWYQVNIRNWDDAHEAYDDDDRITTRFDGYHQHKILYFKQLDN